VRPPLVNWLHRCAGYP